MISADMFVAALASEGDLPLPFAITLAILLAALMIAMAAGDAGLVKG
jgi:hypothetical protein